MMIGTSVASPGECRLGDPPHAGAIKASLDFGTLLDEIMRICSSDSVLCISDAIWQDLSMADVGPNETLDSERLLRDWRWLCPQFLKVIQRNAFGDLFLSDEEGKVHMLNVGSGDFSLIAESVSEFTELAKNPKTREEWFAEREANAAAERGLVLGPGQCIGFYPPIVSVECDGLNSAYVTDLYDNVGWLGDMHRQIATLPDGAKVKIVVQPPKGIS